MVCATVITCGLLYCIVDDIIDDVLNSRDERELYAFVSVACVNNDPSASTRAPGL